MPIMENQMEKIENEMEAGSLLIQKETVAMQITCERLRSEPCPSWGPQIHSYPRFLHLLIYRNPNFQKYRNPNFKKLRPCSK